MDMIDEAHFEAQGPPAYRVHWDIVLLAREINQTFEFIFAEFDLNLTEVALISLVRQHDSLSQSQLAKSLGVGKARLGIVINDLEIKEILERKLDAYDRRVWRIKLTQEGDALSKKLDEKYLFIRNITDQFVDLEGHQQLADNLDEFRMNMLQMKKEIQERDPCKHKASSTSSTHIYVTNN